MSNDNMVESLEKTIMGLAELTVRAISLLPPAKQREIMPKVLHQIMTDVAVGLGDPQWLGVDKPT